MVVVTRKNVKKPVKKLVKKTESSASDISDSESSYSDNDSDSDNESNNSSEVLEYYIEPKKRDSFKKRLIKFKLSQNDSKLVEEGIYDYSKQYCIFEKIGVNFFEAVYNDKSDDIIFNLENDKSTLSVKIF